MALLSEAQWKSLARLYAMGPVGIEYDGSGYGAAGSWGVILSLREHDPTLAREVTRLDPANRRMIYLVVITEAGERFYEEHRRLYNALYLKSD
ncbi:MAG: hypothetical protein HY866_07785 [Chloroflexi bacterium]|nr:hypothetical protein [Chloroflexota bacterium]